MYENESAFSSGAMTFGDIREHTYFLADEQPNNFFFDRDVDRLLNMGFRKVSAEIGYGIERIASADVIETVRSYPLVDPYLNNDERAIVSSVVLLNATTGAKVSSLTAVALDPYLTTSGVPTGYTVVGDTVHLTPIPTAGYRLRVTYRARLPKYSVLTEVVPLSDDQIECAIHYAVWQMKLKDDDVTIADRWRDEYAARLKALTNPRVGIYKAT